MSFFNWTIWKKVLLVRKLWKCSCLRVSIMQYSHAWSYFDTLPGDLHIHPLKTYLPIMHKDQHRNRKRHLRKKFTITAFSSWKDLFFFPLLKAFHYFKTAGMGRTTLSKYLISNVSASRLVFVTENKMVAVFVKDFIFHNIANKG